MLLVGLLLCGFVHAESQSGKVELKELDGGKGIFKLEVGDKMKGVCKLYIADFFEKKVISANVSVKNTADVPMFYHYYVAFFDAEGKLVGCTGQGSHGDDGIEAGKDEATGSCMVTLPIGEYEKIVSYQVCFYEDTKVLGK